jgi:hypothetical protein
VNIEQALARSTSHTEIVSCTGTREEIDGLCAEADGNTDLVTQYGYVDVWGTDDDGVEYRLHITPEEPATVEYAAPSSSICAGRAL